MNKFVLILFLAFIVVARDATADAKRFTVVLDERLNLNHVPLVVAAEKGFFAAQELEIKLISPTASDEPLKLVANDKANIAISCQPQLHVQVNRGLPLKRIGTLIATPLNALVVLKDSPIQTITELKGGKIGYSDYSCGVNLLQVLLQKNGLTRTDVTLVNVNFSSSAVLLSGEVDAVIGAHRNLELNRLESAGKPGRAFYVEEQGIPLYDELIFVANRNSLNDSHLRRFVVAVEQAIHYLINYPEQSWKLFIKRYPEFNTKSHRRAWYDTLTRFALRPAALDQGRYKHFAQFLMKQGIIHTALPVSNYAVELAD